LGAGERDHGGRRLEAGFAANAPSGLSPCGASAFFVVPPVADVRLGRVRAGAT
jgi:hypothetical protein